jgi:hypothetical protein
MNMSPIFKKLNLKDQHDILVVNAPASFESDIATLSGVTVRRDPNKVAVVGFALTFVKKQAELDALSATLAAKAEGDAILWFAYPKGTSKKYQCDFNRDTGWNIIRGAGFDTVRQVAIDDDWSALRFRRVEYIKR